MKKEKITTTKAGQPSGAYSQAIKVGNLVFTACMAGSDPATGKMVSPGNIHDQTIQTLKNLDAALNAAGTSLKNAVRIGAFIHDIHEWATFNEAYKEFFAQFGEMDMPSRTTISVGGFPEGMTVEIDVVAVIPD